MLPPRATKKNSVKNLHGEALHDEYHWMQEKGNADVIDYVSEENRYADTMMRGTRTLQKKLYKEIRARVTEDDMSVPFKDGPYLYYTRTRKGKQYAIHCRKPYPKGKEEIILDENVLAKKSKFFALGSTDISPDHTKLAYATDTTGNEDFTLYIKNLVTGELHPEVIPSVAAVVWSEDANYLFYTKEEHPFPARKVYRHRMGDDPADDQLIYEEKDPQWYVHVSKSRSRHYIFISVGNFDASEEWFMPANNALAQPLCFAPRQKKVKYSVDHHEDHFYIVTNEKAVNFKVMRTPTHKHEKRHWKTWLPYKPERAITGFEAFRDFFAVSLREKGAEWIYIANPRTKALTKVPLPEEGHSLGFHGNLEYESPCIRFMYSSFITPRTVFEYDVAGRELTVRKRQKVPGWDPKGYRSETVWVKNGAVKIPVTLCMSKGRQKKRPLLLNAYGSYGITNDPYFSIAQLSLLKRGWTLAIAHPRGGGEMGWSWHKAAYRMTKHRTYFDLIAVADHLVEKAYTTRDLLAVTGGSAGGMTWGAVMNLRPDLCKAAVIHVPNADVVHSMLDTSLGGTILHYDEIGDPRKKAEYRYIKRWSPYENIKKAEYPALLVRASLHDIRTPFWEAAKWVARLRDSASHRGNLLLKIETHAGHAGKSGRYEWIKEKALDYAFLQSQIQ